MVLLRLWLLGIATSTECADLDGFIMHNCVRSIVTGRSIDYCGPATEVSNLSSLTRTVAHFYKRALVVTLTHNI
jgi:hypothetical protein